jgi:hypothetical protein
MNRSKQLIEQEIKPRKWKTFTYIGPQNVLDQFMGLWNEEAPYLSRNTTLDLFRYYPDSWVDETGRSVYKISRDNELPALERLFPAIIRYSFGGKKYEVLVLPSKESERKFSRGTRPEIEEDCL